MGSPFDDGSGPAGESGAAGPGGLGGSETGGDAMPKWLRTFALPIAVMGIVAAACSSSNTAGNGSPSASCTSQIKVGLALDVGGLGDKGFNDLAYAGMNQAISHGIICQANRSEEHTSELQSPYDLVCRLLLEKKNRCKSKQRD